MCSICDDPKHTDALDDDLSDIFGDGLSTAGANVELAEVALSRAVHESVREAVYEEPCKDCRGTGRFYSYTGRLVGDCFKCKGTGKQRFKTSPETRAAQKQAREVKKAEEARLHAEKVKAWVETNEAEVQWMTAAIARGFEFASAMMQALAKYGYLTEKQMAVIHRCMAQDEKRAAERRAIEERAPDIDAAALDKIHTAFENAISHDIKFPKMRLDRFFFSLVRTGANAGSIYVRSIEKDSEGERTYFGKITEGRFIRAYKCSQETADAIVAAATDPEAAAIAYGRREGACSICGIRLTNHESIDRGIGPICAEKYGW